MGGQNRIDGNNVTDNDYGIQCLNAGNIVIRNTARANTGVNYVFFSNANAVGQILGPAVGTFSTSEAWANFNY